MICVLKFTVSLTFVREKKKENNYKIMLIDLAFCDSRYVEIKSFSLLDLLGSEKSHFSIYDFADPRRWRRAKRICKIPNAYIIPYAYGREGIEMQLMFEFNYWLCIPSKMQRSRDNLNPMGRIINEICPGTNHTGVIVKFQVFSVFDGYFMSQ